MPRKILFVLAVGLFAAGGFFVFVKSATATQAPILNNVTPISACGFSLDFNAPEAGTFKVETSPNQSFVSPNLFFDATDESGHSLSGAGDFQAITTSTGGTFYTPSKNYFFKIKTVPLGGGAESAWSNVSGAMTNDLPAPGAPQNLNADGRDDGSKIYLSWEKGNVSQIFDAYGKFEIWRAVSTDGGENYGSFTLVQRVPANFLDYEDCNVDGNGNCNWLNPNYSYKYYLKAWQSDRGCASNQFVVSGPSPEIIAPAKPRDFSASSPNPSRIDLNWSDNSRGEGNENYFEIWRAFGNNNNNNYINKYSAPSDATGFADSDVQSEKIYFYKIKSCRGVGNCSAFSNEANAATGAAPADDLTGAVYFADYAAAKANIYLSWGAIRGSTYTVLRKEGGTETEVPGCIGANISDCRDLAVPFGKTYEYRLMINGPNTNYSNTVSLNLNIKAVLKGWTWSSVSEAGIGWIKFQSNENAAIKYSVQADATGLMSGNAWGSPGYGWLSFNKSDLDGCPSGVCEARFDFTSGELNGWGRFLTPKYFPDQSSWSGWVHLKDARYSVSFASTTRQFSGLGWGSDILSWLGIGGHLSADLVGEAPPPENQLPVVSGVALEAGPADGLWCADSPFYRVSWSYSDPEHQPQTKAEIRFAPNDFATTSEGTDISFPLYDPLAVLQPNTNYDAWVRVNDGEKWSEWVRSGEGTTTPSHYPPFVGFSWSPTSSIAVGQPVTFTDTSEDRSGGVFPPSSWSWLWQFLNGTPSSSMESVTESRFSALPSDVSLTVGDAGNLSCGLTERIGGAGGPPRRRIFRER